MYYNKLLRELENLLYGTYPHNYTTIKHNLEIISVRLNEIDKLENINAELNERLNNTKSNLNINNDELNEIKKANDILKNILCVRKGNTPFTQDNYYLGIEGSFKNIMQLTKEQALLLEKTIGKEKY